MISLLNVLHGSLIFFSIIFQVLLVRTFGVALHTDIYYMSIGIIQFISLVFSGYFLELFVPVYNDIKLEDEQRAREFVGDVFLVIFLFGTLVSLVVFLISSPIVDLVAPGFTSEKKILAAKFIKILSISILFFSLNRLASEILSAKLFLFLPYYINLITPVLNILTLLVFSDIYGIKAVIFSTTISYIVSFLIYLPGLLRVCSFRIFYPFPQSGLYSLFKKNFVTKTGNLLFLLHSPIVLSILSYFSSGSLTIFSYTKRILEILFSVSNSAVLKTLFVKASIFVSKNMVESLRFYLKESVKANIILLVVLIIPSVFLFKMVFQIVFYPTVSEQQIDSMFNLFLSFIPFYFIHAWRMPFQFIVLTMQNGFKILKVNVAFILIMVTTILLGVDKFGVFIIPFGMMAGNIFGAIYLTGFVNKKLNIPDQMNLIFLLKIIILGLPFLIFNYIVIGKAGQLFFLNLGLIGFWIFLVRKDIINVFRFMTQKGEIF